MTAAKLLSELRSLDIKIWSDNGELFCNAPKGALTADLRAAISQHKAEILAFLSDASVDIKRGCFRILDQQITNAKSLGFGSNWQRRQVGT